MGLKIEITYKIEGRKHLGKVDYFMSFMIKKVYDRLENFRGIELANSLVL